MYLLENVSFRSSKIVDQAKLYKWRFMRDDMNNLICLVGMCGAGKSVVSDELGKRGYQYLRFGQITIDIIRERRLDINEDNEKKIRESLRAEHGMGAYALLNLPKIEKLLMTGNVVADGLYSWTEYKILKKHFGERMKVIAVIAPPALRYERLVHRQLDVSGKNRPLSREQALARDYAEIENIEKAGPIAMADHYLLNMGSLDFLIQQIAGILGKM